MQTHEMDKRAMRERMRILKQARMRSRDEKYAGRAGPPDVQEPAEAVVSSEAAGDIECRVVGARRSEASSAGWDMVGRDEHLHSPRSCPPPCTSHRRARCTVS